MLMLLISVVYMPWNNTLQIMTVQIMTNIYYVHQHIVIIFAEMQYFVVSLKHHNMLLCLSTSSLFLPLILYVNILMRLFCCIVIIVISDIIILCFKVCMMEKLMDHQLDEHNIVKFLGCYQRPPEMVLVFEKLDVNLKKYFDSWFPVPLSEIRSIIQQV